jgi:beta-galactosidase
VTLQKWEEPYYQELTGWTTTGYGFESYNDISAYLAETATDAAYQLPRRGVLSEGPVVFQVKFNIDVAEILDTYFDTENWGKGFVYVNGFNVGRYWPLAGPQMTMYIPKELLLRGQNEIVIVEYQKAPMDMLVKFTDTPRLD